jgi:Spy/CpxP family protein refolding chaperone
MKIPAVIVLAFLVGATAFAQPQRMTPQERADQMAKQLSLTSEQKAKVLDLFLEEQKNMPKRPADGGFDREAMRAAREKRREERNQKMKSILTEEQYAKYEKLRGGPPRGMPEKAQKEEPKEK